MNEIKLPVRAETKLGVWWVFDDFGIPICNTGASEYLAREIIIALNSHGALVVALEWYADGGVGFTGATARAALAKVELIKNTP